MPLPNAEPLYNQIANALIQSIVAGHYQDKLPTEVALAEQFDVSVPTIKKAMTILVENDIVTRIPGKGTFVKDYEKAKYIALEAEQEDGQTQVKKPLVVGVVLPEIKDDFANRLLNGITSALSERGAYGILGLSRNEREMESQIIENFLDIGVDGIVIFPTEGQLYNQDIVRLSLDDFPLVLMDRWLPGIDVSKVVSDHANGTKRAVEYLYELGHQNIALISVSSDSPLSTQSIIERKNGFLQGMENIGMPVADHLVWLQDRSDDENRELDVEFVMNKISSQPDVTALIGISAADTRIAFECANRLGLAVPEDISIIGFDIGNAFLDMGSFFNGGVDGRVAWLDQSEDLIGRESANLICRLVKNPCCKEVIEVPISLHTGASCQAPRHLARLVEK